jgi:orotidine-5'-phosphate decarboxylase
MDVRSTRDLESSAAAARPRTGPPGPEQGFGERLATCVQRRRSQVVLGLDPDPTRLWPRALELTGAADGPPAHRAGRAIAAHCRLLIEATSEQCVAVKPQVACFERLGAPGWAALRETVAAAKEHGLLVICDAKRGDIDVTAQAYAQAYFGDTPTPFGAVTGLEADAMTVNPLLGTDSVLPLLAAARERQSGLFVLVRTSNPGAAEIQELELADGGTVSGRLAALVAALGAQQTGRSGISDVGAVTGATAPERLASLRQAMPHAPFLLPGVGAQGGEVAHLAPAFAAGRAGGLISSSRGIAHASEQSGSEPGPAARAEAARLRELAWGLSA